MTRGEINERLFKEPFEPFRVNTSDGKHYDVLNPRLAVAMDARLFVAFPDNGCTVIVLRQITSIDTLQLT